MPQFKIPKFIHRYHKKMPTRGKGQITQFIGSLKTRDATLHLGSIYNIPQILLGTTDIIIQLDW